MLTNSILRSREGTAACPQQWTNKAPRANDHFCVCVMDRFAFCARTLEREIVDHLIELEDSFTVFLLVLGLYPCAPRFATLGTGILYTPLVAAHATLVGAFIENPQWGNANADWTA
jgi:hypothetical protein